MSQRYVTSQGDMWDSIAYSQLGDVAYTDNLMTLNPAYIGYYVFPAGITLTLPDVSAEPVSSLPPWKQVVG